MNWLVNNVLVYVGVHVSAWVCVCILVLLDKI